MWRKMGSQFSPVLKAPYAFFPAGKAPAGSPPLWHPETDTSVSCCLIRPCIDFFFEEGLEIPVMTSGNWSEEPIVAENQEALTQLAPLADAFLLQDRVIYIRLDDVVSGRGGHSPGKGDSIGGFYLPTPCERGGRKPALSSAGRILGDALCHNRIRTFGHPPGDSHVAESGR